MSERSARSAIAVMAKAPVPGRVKTRLVPPLTPAQATALNAAFLRDVTANIAAAAALRPIDGFVAYAPASGAGGFAGMLAPGTGLLLADGEIAMDPAIRGIGRSLLHAAGALLGRGYTSAILVNSDSPSLPNALLIEAHDRLAAPGDRVVLGPAEDGGYYLIGLKSPHAALFAEIPWSTAAVSGATLARAAASAVACATLPPWFDVDDAASLARLARELAAPPEGPLRPFPAPATRAFLGEPDRAGGGPAEAG